MKTVHSVEHSLTCLLVRLCGVEVANGSEVVINYGTRHSSAVRLALYGFIDAEHLGDDTVHLDFYLRPDDVDRNAPFKRKYFATAWNSEFTQRKRVESMQCFVDDQVSSSWGALGRRRRFYHNAPRVEQRVLGPPLRMKYDGRRRVVVKADFLRFLRLAFLPEVRSLSLSLHHSHSPLSTQWLLARNVLIGHQGPL